MELVAPYQKPIATSVVTLHFPLYIWISVIILTGSIILVIGVIIAAHRDISNPFSVYGDLFGDDARRAASARGFICRDVGLDNQALALCTQHNTERLFSRLDVWISRNSANEIGFLLRENTLRLGDLALLWGRPEIRLYCETLVPGPPAIS
jgi:hypothetical protein